MISNIKPKKLIAMLTVLLFSAVLILPIISACSNVVDDGDPTYTYNEYISQSPSSWNTHNATTDTDTYVQGYTEIGLYDFTLSEDRSTYAFIDEMATGDPVNVTSQYVNQYGITQDDVADTSLGKAWEITLNPDATWENGTAITAEDYVWSMERVLSPDMKNSLAATYITGDYEIYNANNYYSYGATEEYDQIFGTTYTDAELNEFISNGELFISLTEGIVSEGFSYSLSQWHTMQPAFWQNNGTDYYTILEESIANDANAQGYILITTSNFSTIKECLTVLYNNMSEYIPSWYCSLFLLHYSNGEYVQIFGTTYSENELLDFMDEEELYISLTQGIVSEGFSYSLSQWHDLQPAFWQDANGTDYYTILADAIASDADAQGYIQITSANYNIIKECLSVLYNNMSDYIPSWYCSLYLLQNLNVVYNQIFATTYDDMQLATLVASGKLYISLTQGIVSEGFSYSLSQWHDLQPAFWQDSDGSDAYTRLEAAIADDADAQGYILITTENFPIIKECLSVLYNNMSQYIPSWYCSLWVTDYEVVEETPFSNVGIFVTSDNTKFVMVFANALSQWDVKYLLTDNWIVYRPYYEEGYSQQGSLTVTNYGTTSGKYMGYGPYSLQSYQTDSQITFVRNENWYGYQEGSTNYHPGQFQTDRIVCRIIDDQNTALLEFEAGNLDSVRLNANNMEQYRFSDYLLTRSASNTWSITFNSDVDTLASIESDGQGNRRVLSIEDFRRAISLSINRTHIGQNIMAGSAAAYSFINSNYYYDMENDPDSIYRNSEQAMQAIVKLYNISYGEGERYATLEEAYRAVSGYDVEAARAAFQSAYEYAIANNLYTDGQNIKINIYNNTVSTQLTALGNYLQTCINEATTGTPFANKITVEIRSMQSGRYDAISQGRIEAIYYSFAGDYNDPNGMLANFTDPDVQTILECGFDPTTEEFSITYDFNDDGTEETITKSYRDWQRSLTAGGEYYGADMGVKLTIMSEVEYQLLSGFRTLPLVVGTDLTLRSMKVNYATNTSNIFAMYGGVRLMTYNYSDTEWANFIRDTGNLVYE